VCCRSLADLVRALPSILREAHPSLLAAGLVLGMPEDLERTLHLRQLQTAYVHSLVLLKRAKVGLVWCCGGRVALAAHPFNICRLSLTCCGYRQ
jgi:hypothetical protein